MSEETNTPTATSRYEIRSRWTGAILMTVEAETLSGADLSGADLTPIRDDLWAVLSSAPAEARGVLAALEAGKVDGSTYHGECACLVGTIANVRNCDIDEIPSLTPDSSRPAEIFFYGIRLGDTPDTNPFAKLAHGWIKEWIDRMEAAFAPSAGVDGFGVAVQ